MLLLNGYEAEIISRFVKYIDVYSESEIEIVFNIVSDGTLWEVLTAL